MRPNIPTARDKVLFTPGPLTTSLSVKQAMLHDAGSWHFEFNAVVKQVREKILALSGVPRGGGYEAALTRGTRTIGVEAGRPTGGSAGRTAPGRFSWALR